MTTKTTDEFQGVYVVYGRDSTQGNSFPAVFELSSLLPAHGGNGSEGFVIPVSSPTTLASVRSAGDVNNDGIGDIVLADPFASPLGRTDAGQAWVIFGQGTNFPVTFDLASLNGSNGFTVYGKTGEALGLGGARSAGDVNGDNADDLVISSSMSTCHARTQHLRPLWQGHFDGRSILGCPGDFRAQRFKRLCYGGIRRPRHCPCSR